MEVSSILIVTLDDIDEDFLKDDLDSYKEVTQETSKRKGDELEVG